MQLSLRKNGLTSLFKEVRVLKDGPSLKHLLCWVGSDRSPQSSQNWVHHGIATAIASDACESPEKLQQEAHLSIFSSQGGVAAAGIALSQRRDIREPVPGPPGKFLLGKKWPVRIILLIFPGNSCGPRGAEKKNEKSSSRYRYEDLMSQYRNKIMTPISRKASLRLIQEKLLCTLGKNHRWATVRSVSEPSRTPGHTLGTEEAPQRNCVTKILPNIRVNFLVWFASRPCCTGKWPVPPRIVQKLFGAVRVIFCFVGPFWILNTRTADRHALTKLK